MTCHTSHVAGGADAGQMKGEHGEVCPVNWGEDGRTVQGDPIATLDHIYSSRWSTRECQGELYEACARRPTKVNMSVEDGGESYEPPNAGHRFPHSLDIQAMKN